MSDWQAAPVNGHGVVFADESMRRFLIEERHETWQTLGHSREPLVAHA